MSESSKQEACPPLILGDYLIANSSSLEVGTVVSLQCKEGYTYKRGPMVLECMPDSYWSDDPPFCLEDSEGVANNGQVLIIVISAAATAVALGILICAIYMLITNIRKNRKAKQADSPPPPKKDIMETLKDLRLLNDAPQDNVGMPAVVFNNMNTILRGRVESAETDVSDSVSPVSEAESSSAGSEKVFIY